ncbi:4-hydroxythreonine-4-phosphate dehydrogenase PdxA [Pelagibacterium xiamenense]|uniref:4-hydroxythreonine-4-phosphate dehydrogenase PdxA n=1 Tax=Pelagibacterium xiamenense TaxID=2901140 RepID=UPI001E33D491|nr:4-hydroxythreonine-4-phosphate dehydrogenase PdxA [Pelagibacterium xiamenense]MCD7060828.1 4-hydroxythreonine-4-phosphate dehydrogenase PdxA [Pelagibacterium xiamenense]
MTDEKALPLAVSMGEPAGIGPDLILQLYADRQAHDLPVFAVYGVAEFLAARAARLGLRIDCIATDVENAAEVWAFGLPVVDLDGDVKDRPGKPDAAAAPVVIEAIARAVADVRDGRARALVTAPIHKAALYGAGFSHPGHTEFLAALCADDGAAPHPVMMLAHEDLRVVPLTIHVPLAAVPGMISGALIEETVRVVVADLTARFGIAAPRIAVAGLNPHAGEDGTIGREEIEVIAPALARLKAEGFDVTGPLSGDTLFHPPHWREFDAVIAMYHDQALIPIKALAFDAGVNVTLGLPIVRTSPDHGTAFSLAGSGNASAKSMLAALRLADAMA